MIRVAILEDERPAREHLARAVRAAGPAAEIVALLDSVASAVAWLRANPPPDLLFADIQLSDGLALDVFDAVDLGCPVVFCTAYDEYLTEAMRHDGIDYLQKPIRDEHVSQAIEKYRRLGEHFGARLRTFVDRLRTGETDRRRILARSGSDWVSVPLARVAYLEVVDKVVFVVTIDDVRHVVDRPLAEIEADLPSDDFFRLNRQYVVHARAVKRFRTYFKGRLVVDLSPAARAEVVVSQENAARFRAWMDR